MSPLPDPAWVLRLPTSGTGPRLAVKDCIDIAGTITGGGSRAVTATAVPALVDAPVVAAARAQGARIVGKTGLVELCLRADGLNEWAGTPRNPLDPARIPGGSSSGSAVVVATGEADVAYGTDTGGSVRVPAACCGVAGLKTTAGRLSTLGVLELSRTLDTVGILARDVAGLALGMALAEPGFVVAAAPAGARPRVVRLRPDVTSVHVDAAVDHALAAAGASVVDVAVPEWEQWCADANDLMAAEYWAAQRQCLRRPELLEARHAADIAAGERISAARVVRCRRSAAHARDVLGALLRDADVLALPTLDDQPPLLGAEAALTRLTVPLNLAGLPAVALPVTAESGAIPASLQLVGSWLGEERLLGWAAVIELAPASGPPARRRKDLPVSGPRPDRVPRVAAHTEDH